MEQVIQSLTRLKLTGSPVMQPPSTSEHEFPVTGVRRRLKRAEGCAKGISSFEWIIKQSVSYNTGRIVMNLQTYFY
jgi:hypothetical protein